MGIGDCCLPLFCSLMAANLASRFEFERMSFLELNETKNIYEMVSFELRALGRLRIVFFFLNKNSLRSS